MKELSEDLIYYDINEMVFYERKWHGTITSVFVKSILFYGKEAPNSSFLFDCDVHRHFGTPKVWPFGRGDKSESYELCWLYKRMEKSAILQGEGPSWLTPYANRLTNAFVELLESKGAM